MKNKLLLPILVLLLIILTACGGRTVTINFDSQGGSPVESLKVKQLTALGEIPSPLREGYSFQGWYYERTYDTPFEDFETGVTRNLTLYAKWSINSYTISFVTESDEEITPIVQEYNTVIEIPLEISKPGHTFDGWYIDSERTILFEETRMPSSNTILYAKWLTIVYTVEFYVEGVLLTERFVEYGKTITNFPQVPEKEGFSGTWDESFDVLVTDHLVINANYTINSYLVVFRDDTGNIYYQTNVEFGNKVSIPEEPSKPGFTFAGYSEDLDTLLITKDMEIIVSFIPITYTVTFRAQGVVLKNETVNYGQNATPPVVNILGYQFVSWDKSFENILTDLVINAVLEPINYEMIFDGNGGLFIDQNPLDTLLKPYNSSFTYTTQPTRNGYHFEGWYLNASGSGDEIIFNNYIVPLNGLTVYAKWAPINYNITYENLFSTDHGNPINYTIDSEINLDFPTTRTGYQFSGWYSDLEVGDLVTNINKGTTGNLVLYARWTPQEYTITYHNLLDTTTNNPTTYNIETNTFSLTNPSDRTGYSFVGWFTDLTSGSEVSQIILGSTGNRNLYARWSAKSYSINFNTDGGIAISSLSVYFGQPFTLPTTTKDGYTFNGWKYLDEAFISSVWEFDFDITVEAQWTEWPSITLLNHDQTTFYIISVLPGSDISAPTSPSRLGYEFIGWYEDEATTISYNFTIMPNENLVIYSKWEPINYTISFNIDGLITNVSLPFDSVIALEHVPIIPSKDNHDITPPYWNNNPIGMSVTGDMVFIAVYVGNPLTISFETNGGNNISEEIVLYGETLEKPLDPTKPGYIFLAWYQDMELVNVYDFNDSVTENLTLYAAWQIEFYTIEIISTFLKEDLDDPNLIDNVGTWIQERANLFYGQEISVISNFETYVFDYFVYNGVEYTSAEQLITVTGDSTVNVYYRHKILQITFIQVPNFLATEPTPVTDVIKVYYNSETSPEPPALLAPVGTNNYLAVWDRVEFKNLRENIIVYALYYETGVKTVTFIDRGIIKYVAAKQDPGNTEELILGPNSILWDLYQPGFLFKGWYTETEGAGIKITKATALFSNPAFTTNNNIIYAYWEELSPFSAPINININIDEENITISWDLNPPKIGGLAPTYFRYILNNRIVDGQSEPVLINNSYSLTITPSHPEYEELKALLEPGTYTLAIQARGDEENHYHGPISETKEFVNTSIFDGDPTEVATYEYFIIETYGNTKRYVFYTNLEYQFSNSYLFEVVDGHEFVSVDNNRIMTGNMTGSFRFRMIKDGATPEVFDALIVHDIKQFSFGSNYQNFLDAKQAAQTPFLQTSDTYYVGANNLFNFDLRMTNNQGVRVPLAQSYLSYQLEIFNGSSFTAVEDFELYAELKEANKIKFSPLAINERFRMTVKPRYQASKMEVDSLVYEFIVNDGHNAFTNQDLKTLFANFDVQTINIHANIKAELSNNQKNGDGSPINKRPETAEFNGNVYSRYSKTVDNDDIVIEGNFMTIDGSALPYSNGESGSGLVGFAQAFEIVNVQVAIFSYNVSNNPNNDNIINNNSFTMNNLLIKGNTTLPYVDFTGTAEEIEIQERLMSRNSGGYIGIYTSLGEMNLNNNVVFNTVIAVYNNAYGQKDNNQPTYANVDYLSTYNSWGNSFYLHSGNGINITNSEIGQSGGAAIHLVDARKGSGINNPVLVLDETTTIENWISGEEAWFKAYGMSQTALLLKSGIETGISTTGRSIIQEIIDPVSGFMSEKINLILLTEPSQAAVTYSDPEQTIENGGSEISLNINGQVILRPWNFLSTDPRVNSGQFAFPIGMYADWSAFQALIGDIVPIITPYYPGGTPEHIIINDATNLAMFAAFYNLTAQEVVDVNGHSTLEGISMKAATIALYPGKQAPNYLEINAPMPLFPTGFASVIVEFAPIS